MQQEFNMNTATALSN